MNTENNYTATDLGNISPNPRGEYAEAMEYEYLDLVAMQGGSYICLAELGTTIAGIAPEPGQTTKYWQCIAIPGDLTPEYIVMHDDVVNKYKSAAEDRQAIEQLRDEISGMESNVEQLQEQTQNDAASAEQSKDSSAGYAAAAEASRQAAATSEANVNAQVNGFDQHVKDQTGAAEGNIAEKRRQAVEAVTAQQVQSVQDVKNQTAEYINAKTTEAKEEITIHTSAKIEAADEALKDTQKAAAQTIANANEARGNLEQAVEDASQLETDIGAAIANAKAATSNANAATTAAEAATAEAETQAAAAKTAAEAVMAQVNHLTFAVNAEDGGLDITYS